MATTMKTVAMMNSDAAILAVLQKGVVSSKQLPHAGTVYALRSIHAPISAVTIFALISIHALISAVTIFALICIRALISAGTIFALISIHALISAGTIFVLICIRALISAGTIFALISIHALITVPQGIMFEASDRSRSLSLAQINNLGSDLSLASIVKIACCLQVFVLTSSFLSIRFTRKVSPLYNIVFRLQYSEFTYHPSPAMAIAARCTKIARTPSKLCWPPGL